MNKCKKCKRYHNATCDSSCQQANAASPWLLCEAELAKDLVKARAEASRLEFELRLCRDVIETLRGE